MLRLFLAALIVRLGFVLTLDPAQLYWPDERLYDGIAQGLAAGKGFVAEGYNSTPLWPAVMACLYKLFGHSYTVVRMAQSVLGALTCVIACAAAARLFDRRVGMWTGWVLAFYPSLIYLAGVFYMENLYAFCLAAVVYALVCLGNEPTFQRAMVAGLLLGVTALSRSVALILIPAAAAVPWLAAGVEWRRRLALCAVLWAAAAAVVAPWTARNWHVFGHLVPVSTGGGLTLWRGNCEFSRGDASDRYLSPEGDWWGVIPKTPENNARLAALRARLKGLDEVDADRVLAQEARRFMAEQPLRCAALYAKKLLTLHAAYSQTRPNIGHGSPRNQFVATASYYPVLALALVGMALHGRRWRELRVPYLVLLLFSLSLPLLTTCTRFRLPTEPLLVMFAVAAGVWLFDRLRMEPASTRLVAAIAVAAVAVRLLWCALLPNDFVWQDEWEYDTIARNLLDRGVYSLDGERPTAFRAPGQTLFIAAAYSLDRGFAGIRVWQSLLWGMAVWLAFRVARELGASERAALWTAAGVAVYPVYIYAAGTLFPITLFTVVLLAGTLGMLRVYNGAGWPAVVLAGAGLGVGALTIPYLVPVALLVPFWLGLRRWRAALGVVALALVIFAPWPLRNWTVFGEPVMGTQQWLCFWYGNNPKATGSSGSKIQLAPRAMVWVPYYSRFQTNELAGERFLRDDALRYVREHPGHTAWLWLRKAANLFRLWPETQTQNIYTIWLAKLAGALSFGPVLLLGLVGWWRAGLDRRRAAVIVLYLAVFTLVAAVTLSKDRYRMPLDVYLMIPAAMLVERWLSARQSCAAGKSPPGKKHDAA